MFCQAEDLEILGDGCLDDLFEGVFGMAGAELARVAVVGEWHFVVLGVSLPGVSQLMVLWRCWDGGLTPRESMQPNNG